MRLKGPGFFLHSLQEKRQFSQVYDGRILSTSLVKFFFSSEIIFPANKPYVQPVAHFSLACVTSKHFSKRAVLRNRTRRRMRMAIFHALHTMPQNSSTFGGHAGLILKPKFAIKNASFSCLLDDCRLLLKKALAV